MASSPSEHEIQQRIRLACGRGPVRLWRNNTGALVDQQGRLRALWALQGQQRPDRPARPGGHARAGRPADRPVRRPGDQDSPAVPPARSSGRFCASCRSLAEWRPCVARSSRPGRSWTSGLREGQANEQARTPQAAAGPGPPSIPASTPTRWPCASRPRRAGFSPANRSNSSWPSQETTEASLPSCNKLWLAVPSSA